MFCRLGDNDLERAHQIASQPNVAEGHPYERRRVAGRAHRGVAGSIRSGRVIEILAKLMTVHGAPKCLRSDNGPEFVSAAILRWLSEVSVETAHIDPGRPWQNGTDESFNGKFRDECLSMEWFRSRSEATAIIETWRRHYNEVRPHSSLGYLTPHEFSKQQEQSATTHGREAVL